MSRRLNDTSHKIQLLRGESSDLSQAEHDYGVEGEPLYATDSKQVYVHDGAEYKQISVVRTSTAADPSTTELPNDGDASIHKNTSSGDVFLAYNDGGAIVKVQLT